uniref:Uncharacterized protein n=1 Tax=Candidatus Kentrum sp. UNK TaxID=2126344 RepID=A0A451AS73_9GAMM|nr:MAG: hypothetical protein BECKUNK1418G_GA0071005_12833 [Candidatus Kentron sp. UNK]VFK73353.1 MAG: hypothetical protein BECKUNK1418H_GA0071006_11922 [Candidatus Kentron sp. UNK]
MKLGNYPLITIHYSLFTIHYQTTETEVTLHGQPSDKQFIFRVGQPSTRPEKAEPSNGVVSNVMRERQQNSTSKPRLFRILPPRPLGLTIGNLTVAAWQKETMD